MDTRTLKWMHMPTLSTQLCVFEKERTGLVCDKSFWDTPPETALQLVKILKSQLSTEFIEQNYKNANFSEYLRNTAPDKALRLLKFSKVSSIFHLGRHLVVCWLLTISAEWRRQGRKSQLSARNRIYYRNWVCKFCGKFYLIGTSSSSTTAALASYQP